MLAGGCNTDDARDWLELQLRPMGEDPRGLVRFAVQEWFDRAADKQRASKLVLSAAAALLAD